MFKPHTKFKVSTITCNEEMKGNAKCKNSHFESHPSTNISLHVCISETVQDRDIVTTEG